MNIQDFSAGFDTLLNSYATQANFGEQASKAEIVLDEYEKSMFLTKAQDEIIISLYNGKNPYGDSFESTEEMRRYLSNLITEDKLSPITSITGNPLGIDSKSKFFTLPENLWFITYESIILGSGGGKCVQEGKVIEVVPVAQDEYHRIKKNPFRGANSRRALRLDLSDGVVEIVSTYTNVGYYYIRYFRRARPIILTDVSDANLTINGESHVLDMYNPCELHDALHHKILDRAVLMALQSRGIKVNS